MTIPTPNMKAHLSENLVKGADLMYLLSNFFFFKKFCLIFFVYSSLFFLLITDFSYFTVF